MPIMSGGGFEHPCCGSVDSPRAGACNWIPSGSIRPSTLVNPPGRKMPQMPAMLAFTVYRSQRYIESGSLLAPQRGRQGGVVGPSRTSHRSRAELNSSRISRLTWSAFVVRVVVAGAEHIGAEHDSSLDFRPEMFGPTSRVQIEQCLAGFQRGTLSVADAVESGEIARRFGGADHGVGGDADDGQWKFDVDDLGSEAAEDLDRTADRLVDRFIISRIEVLGGEADPQSLDRRVEILQEIGSGAFDGGRVMHILARNGGENGCGVLDASGERSDLVQAWSETDQSVPGDSPVGGFDAYDSTQGCRLSNRAPGVAPERDRRELGRHGGGTAAGRTAGHPSGVPRIAYRAEGAVLRDDPIANSSQRVFPNGTRRRRKRVCASS